MVLNLLAAQLELEDMLYYELETLSTIKKKHNLQLDSRNLRAHRL